MIELLSLSVGIGLATGLLFTELFGIASGGLIVPGYIALHLQRPGDIAITVGVGYLTFLVVRTASTFLIVYGRRRTALMILVGYILGMFVGQWSGVHLGGEPMRVIGFIIPGLIGIWMDRQGVVQTLASLVIVSVVVRLVLIITVGAELLS